MVFKISNECQINDCNGAVCQKGLVNDNCDCSTVFQSGTYCNSSISNGVVYDSYTTAHFLNLAQDIPFNLSNTIKALNVTLFNENKKQILLYNNSDLFIVYRNMNIKTNKYSRPIYRNQTVINEHGFQLNLPSLKIKKPDKATSPVIKEDMSTKLPFGKINRTERSTSDKPHRVTENPCVLFAKIDKILIIIAVALSIIGLFLFVIIIIMAYNCFMKTRGKNESQCSTKYKRPEESEGTGYSEQSRPLNRQPSIAIHEETREESPAMPTLQVENLNIPLDSRTAITTKATETKF